jgi:hypothetical protein
LDNVTSKFSYSKKKWLAGAGTQASALAFGGQTTTAITAATEEYTKTGTVGIKTITVS